MDRAEIDAFKEQGFVIIRGLIPTAQVDAWRHEAWDTLTIDEDDVEHLWPNGGTRNAGLFKPEHQSRLLYPYTAPDAVADPQPFQLPVGDEPHVKAVLDQLLGEDTWDKGIAAPGEQGHIVEPEVVVFNWPLPPEKRHADVYGGVDPRDRGGGHIEGYRGATKGGPTAQWQVACTLYLDDVWPGGGATYVWPKSHLAVHRYFKAHPEDIPTGGAICTSKPSGHLHGIPPPRVGNGMSESYMRTHLPGGYDGGEPFEAVMKKGDVMCVVCHSQCCFLDALFLKQRDVDELFRFWHHWCVHASTYNGSDKVRQAVIARFHSTLPGHPLLWDDGGVGTTGFLWKYWGDAVRDDGKRGGAAADLLAGRGQVTEWEVAEGPDWQGPIWVRKLSPNL